MGYQTLIAMAISPSQLEDWVMLDDLVRYVPSVLLSLLPYLVYADCLCFAFIKTSRRPITLSIVFSSNVMQTLADNVFHNTSTTTLCFCTKKEPKNLSKWKYDFFDKKKLKKNQMTMTIFHHWNKLVLIREIKNGKNDD